MNTKQVTAKLDALSNLIKRAPEICEIADISMQNIYDSIEESCDVATQKILDAIPIYIDEYEINSASWKIAWKDHRDILLAYCQEMLGDSAKRKKKEPLGVYSKRLLFECHRSQVASGWKERLPVGGLKESKFVEDQTAHEILKKWGGMSMEAFKIDFEKADQDIIERAA